MSTPEQPTTTTTDAPEDGAADMVSVATPEPDAAPAIQPDLGDAGQPTIETISAERDAALADAAAARDEAQQGLLAVQDKHTAELARARFEAIAARRNPRFDADDILDLIDTRRFVFDGVVDDKSIAAAVKRLVPAPDPGVQFEGGARQSVQPRSVDDMIRKAAGR